MKRILLITLIFISLLFILSTVCFAQPCPPVCDNCVDECSPSCMSNACQICIQTPASEGGCLGADIPITDNVGFVMVGGLIISSFYFIRRRKVVVI